MFRITFCTLISTKQIRIESDEEIFHTAFTERIKLRNTYINNKSVVRLYIRVQ